MDPVQQTVAGQQRDGQAQRMAEYQAGRRNVLTQALEGLPGGLWRAIEQAAVLLVGQGVRVAGAGQLALEGGEVAGQGADGTQQAAPGRVLLLVQITDGGVEV